MKTQHGLLTALAVSVLGVCYVEIRLSQPLSPAEGEYELAVPMGRMQGYMDKLYFSGQSANWPLASFYLHEIDEQAEEVVHSGVVEDGINVSQLAGSMLLPMFEGFEKALEQEDVARFADNYSALVNGCNACHQA